MWGMMFRFWRRLFVVLLVLPALWALMAGVSYAQIDKGNTGAVVVLFALLVLGLDVMRSTRRFRK